jgi:colanic acid biosynthesis protein WcaH
MTMEEAIGLLDNSIPDRTKGLPEEIFYFISRTTPLVNVDLLVKDGAGRTLLSFRNDEYCGRGWHIPGGIVRYKETFAERIQKTAESELGTGLCFDPQPLAVEQIIKPAYRNRAHFISFLFKCSAPEGFMPENRGREPGDAGFLQWHDCCPENLIDCHLRYKKYIDGLD